MRFDQGRASENVEDRRGRGMVAVGGGGLGLFLLALVAMYFGIDPRFVLQIAGPPRPRYVEQNRPTDPAENEAAKFVSFVLADTEDTWNEIFRQSGRTYREPKLVLFKGMVQSACGMTQAAVGPFYCPADEKVYIDLDFYEEMKNRFRAPGDFAQAYVIAHEIGHHVQNLLGISRQVQSAMSRMPKAQANQLSVRTELQADCLAGVWAANADRARGILESGDLEDGLRAASAIGDDKMMRRSTGYVVPDAFTHGSSDQRVRWFKRGLETGRFSACDTFNAPQL
ncbi:zinc metallopeptidase [bacterium]|nr:zinc metallopeptidase [bacterium]